MSIIIEHDVQAEIKDGLRENPKTLPTYLLYDEKGSLLFEQITRLDEYYPTKTEITIFRTHLPEMISVTGFNLALIELGSGNSEKTQSLLKNHPEIDTYVPIDISKSFLEKISQDLKKTFPKIDIQPLAANYLEPMDLSFINEELTRLFFFPGSTIGNFHPEEAVSFLSRLKQKMHHQGGLLIGVDMKKDKAILELAYDDPKGVTAAFNKNLLQHVIDLTDASIDLDAFTHKAVYNEACGRVEMHLEAVEDTEIHLDGELFSLRAGESIWTESSYKYTKESFSKLAHQAGLSVKNTWTDDNHWFRIFYLVPKNN